MNIRCLRYGVIIFALLFGLFPSHSDATPRVMTYMVNSNTDAADANPGDGVCATIGGNCTLRAAIQEANRDGTVSNIQFVYRFVDSNSILLNDDLPPLTENNTTIDASDQFNHAGNRPGVQIASSLSDQILDIRSEGNTILGIFFGGAPVGIKVAGNSNTIGGPGDGERNVFINPQYGVHIHSGSYHSVISNYFGTIDGETAISSVSIGIYAINTHHNLISDNLIVGFQTQDTETTFPPSGIVLYYSYNNEISNNIIGMDWGKLTAIGNTIGIFLQHADSTDIGSGNLIAGNLSHGIHALSSENFSIFDNDIGFVGSSPIGNGGHGIFLETMVNGLSLYNNSIRHNSGSGIWSSGSFGTIQDNDIYENESHGIYLTGSNNIIGGTFDYESNNISYNQGNGIYLDGACYNTISGNFVSNNNFGILLENGAKENRIGGNTANESNLIWYNVLDGIRIQDSSTNNNLVIGNMIGYEETGYKVGNGHHGIGIYAGAHNNQIGTTNVGEANYILNSGWSGVVIVNSSENFVEGNLIGTDGAEISTGNAYYGVNIVGSVGVDNQVSMNVIAYNGTFGGVDNNQAGIKIDGSSGNMISRNSIHDNDGPGIALINNGNSNMAAPIITMASCNGPIEGTAEPFSCVQIFSDNDDEGRIWEGTTQANATGVWSWPGKVRGPNITATARDNTTNDTSPFSVAFTVGICEKYFFLPLIMK
jgi:trimeric autotransporter adhesin